MRRHHRTSSPEPVAHRPAPGGLAALRHDLGFAVGVIVDTLRGRPFAS